MSFRDDETTKTTEPDFGARLLGPRPPVDEEGDGKIINPFPPGVGKEPEIIECITPEPDPAPGEGEPLTGPGVLGIKAEPRKRRRHTPHSDEEMARALAEYRALIRSGRLPS